MSRFWSLILAFSGIFLHSAGVLMQKKGTGGINFKELLNIKNIRYFKITRELIIWVAGLMLAYNISVIPTALASKELSPQLVSAISGLGIVIIVILSHYFLKEKIFRSDIIYSFIIVLSIIVLSFLQKKEAVDNIDIKAFYLLTLCPLLLLIPIFTCKISNKAKAILFSTVSGLTGGVAYVVLNISMKVDGATIAGAFTSIYLYEYIIIGFVSGFFLQFAYKFGDIIHIVPVQMSLTVVYPLICYYFVFHKAVSLIEDFLILVITLCCLFILKKH